MDACVSHNPQNAISGQERPHSTSFRVQRDPTGATEPASWPTLAVCTTTSF